MDIYFSLGTSVYYAKAPFRCIVVKAVGDKGFKKLFDKPKLVGCQYLSSCVFAVES